MKTKWIEILLNVVFWIVTGWLISRSFSIQGQEVELINDQEFVRIVRNETIYYKLLFCVAFSFIVFYGNLLYIGGNYKRTSGLKLISFSLATFVLSVLLYFYLESLLFPKGSIKVPVAISMGILSFYFTFSSAYGIVKILAQSEKHQKQLLLDKQQAELNLLRNQLQPHFLFNALNNLLAMVEQQQSPQLAGAFEKLSMLLRYVIEETRHPRVSLDKEIAFIKNYAALQLLRFEAHEVDFNFSVEGTYKDQLLEPGLLIPFVENAFKYGTEPEQRSTIQVRLDIRQEDAIRFSVKNDICNVSQMTHNTGTGIAATRARLQLVYPNKHQLKITDNAYFFVELTIHTR